MTNALVLFCLLCCLAISPVVSTSRLFVDEITGYTNEDVSATNVKTPLLVVNQQTIENGVAATGGVNPHFVDTSGTASFSTGSFDVTTAQSIEITALGENVALTGGAVTLSSVDSFTIETVETSLLAQQVSGTIGGEFATFGSESEIRSSSDSSFTIGADLFVLSEERVKIDSIGMQFTADPIAFESAESNLFASALDLLSITTDGPIAFVADSGIEMGSSHGTATISALNEVSVKAENFIFTTETNYMDVSGDLTLETESVAGDIFMNAERTYIGGVDTSVHVTSTGGDSQTAFLTSGTIESSSDSFSASGSNIDVISVADSIFLTNADIDMTASSDFHLQTSVGSTFIGNDHITLESTSGNIGISSFGHTSINNAGRDFEVTAAIELSFESGSTSVTSITSLDLSAERIIGVAAYVDFYSARNLIVDTASVAVSATGNAIMDSHESSSIRSDDTSFTAAATLSVLSTGPISFPNSDDFSNTAGIITYRSYRESTMVVNEATITAADIEYESRDYLKFLAGSLTINASDSVTLTGQHYFSNSGSNFVVNSVRDISWDTASTGGYLFDAGSVSFNSADLFQVDSDGNIVFTSNDLLVDTETLSVGAETVVITSSSAGVFVQGETSLIFDSPNTFINLPTFFNSAGMTTVSGTSGVTFSGGIRNGDVTTIAAANFISDHKAVDVISGYIDVTTETLTLGTTLPDAPLIDFSTSGELDFILLADTIDFDVTNMLHASGSNMIMEASESVDIVAAARLRFFNDERFALYSTGDASFDAATIALTSREGNLLLHAHKDVDVITAKSSVSAGGLIDFLSADAFLVDALPLISLTTTGHGYMTNELLTINTSGDISMEALSAHFVYEDILLDSSFLQLLGAQFNSKSVDTTTVSAVDVLVTGGDIFVNGGAIDVISTNFLATGVTSLLVGASPSTPSDINLEDVSLTTTGGLEMFSAAAISIIARSSEVVEQLGISIHAVEFDVSGADMLVFPSQGAHVNTPAFTSSSVEETTLSAQHGALLSYASESIELTSTISDITVNALEGGILIQAFEGIISEADSVLLRAGREINMVTETGSMTFEAAEALDIQGAALTLNAGLAGASNGISFTTGDADFSFGEFLRFHSLGDRTVTQERQISVSGGGLVTFDAAEAFSFYASGDHSIIVDTDATFTAGGELSMGSVSDAFTVVSRDGSTSLVSLDTFSAKASGVDGNVLMDSVSFVSTVTGAMYGSANGTMSFDNIGTLVLSSAADINVNTLNDKAKISVFGGADLQFSTLLSPTDSNIEVIGQNIHASSTDMEFLAPTIALGISPRVTMELASFSAGSVGDITISSPLDGYLQYSDDAFFVTALDVAFTAGGEMGILTDGEGATGDFTVTATGDIAMIAAGFLEFDVLRGQVLHQAITLSSEGTNTGNGMSMFLDTSDLSFLPTGDFAQVISKTSAIRALDDILVSAEDMAISSGTLLFDSDNDLSFLAAGVTSFVTSGPTAKISAITEGVRGHFFMDSEAGTLAVTSGEDIFVLAQKLYAGFETGATFTATGLNSGKIELDASDTILFDAAAVVNVIATGKTLVEANGENSMLTLSGFDGSFTATSSIIYNTATNEGGSILFESESQESNLIFTATDALTVDVDGDVTMSSSTQTFSVTRLAVAAGGYGDISAGDVTISNDEFSLIAEAADIHLDGGDNVQFLADVLTVNMGSIHVSVFDNSTLPDLGFTNLDIPTAVEFEAALDLSFTAEDGSLSMGAYTSFSAIGSFVLFDNEAIADHVGLSMTTSHPGADVKVESGEGSHMIASNIYMEASGTEPDSGYIKIRSDSLLPYDDGSVNPFTMISSGEETTLFTETGDIIGEYSSHFEVSAGDIHALAGTAIEFSVRGDGRSVPISNDDTLQDNILASKPRNAYTFDQLSGVQFTTEDKGDILIHNAASAVYLTSTISTIRSATDLYVESTSAVQFLTGFDQEGSNNLHVRSSGDIRMTTYDNDINIVSGTLILSSTAFDGQVRLSTEKKSSLLINTSNFFVDVDNVSIASDEGHVTLSALETSFTADVVRFEAAKDVIVEGHTVSVGGTLLHLQTIESATFSDNIETVHAEDGIITFDGQKGNEFDYPVVVFENPILLVDSNINQETYDYERFSFGAYCEVNRQIIFGSVVVSPFAQDADSVCVCSDHTWLCLNDLPYYYEYSSLNALDYTSYSSADTTGIFVP